MTRCTCGLVECVAHGPMADQQTLNRKALELFLDDIIVARGVNDPTWLLRCASDIRLVMQLTERDNSKGTK